MRRWNDGTVRWTDEEKELNKMITMMILAMDWKISKILEQTETKREKQKELVYA